MQLEKYERWVVFALRASFLGEARSRRGSYIPTPLVKEPYL